MKQTAVEWLYNNLKSHFEHDGDLLECVQMSMQQAKEIEKEQMIDFVLKWMGEDDLKEDVIKHYNETFNANEK